MDPSIRRVSGSQGLSRQSTLGRDATDLGPIPGSAEEGLRRSRIGSSRVSLWNRRRIGLLVLGVIVLLWLLILGSERDATPTRWARGVGEAPIPALAFAPDGEVIATVQMDRRVALRDTTGGGGITAFLDYPGCASATPRGQPSEQDR
jgi:hypothetical protein